MNANLPPPHKAPFAGAINHPALYLWDAWSYCEGDVIHLYCLAVSRTDEEGNQLQPGDRNSKPFHVRHFLSEDNGQTWADQGVFQQPRLDQDTFDSKTIWSGSIAALPSGKKLVAYTGLYKADAQHSFRQNIALAISNDGYAIDQLSDEPLSCAIRDWAEITGKGYYLDAIESLGSDAGEGGGPITAWRDPFIFTDDDKQIHLFWGAKVGTHRAAMAHASIAETDQGFKLTKLFPPTVMPDGEEFTQLELPKVLHDKFNGEYYLIISTCKRLYEGQTDAEVDKKVRLYSSASLRGPWQPHGLSGSVILADDSHMFGLSVLRADFDNKALTCIAPYTDAADGDIGLTLSRPFSIKLDPTQILDV